MKLILAFRVERPAISSITIVKFSIKLKSGIQRVLYLMRTRCPALIDPTTPQLASFQLTPGCSSAFFSSSSAEDGGSVRVPTDSEPFKAGGVQHGAARSQTVVGCVGLRVSVDVELEG